MTEITNLAAAAEQAVAAAESLDALEEARLTVLGKKGWLSAALKELGALTPDERKARAQMLNAVKDRLFDEGAKLAQEQHAVRSEVVTQLESATPDAQRLHALVDERIEAMRAFAHKAADAALEVHGTLTPEQRKALATEFRERTGVK